MQYGFVIPGGDVGDHLRIGQEIEHAGWDGVFVADGVYAPDPWVSLAAIAARTERVRLGPLLTPPSRRRPWKLASEVATLDRLSGGRAVLPVGLGAIDTGFERVGEATDRKMRARLLEECLEIVTLFWRGQPFTYEGEHYKVSWGTDWTYGPIQKPRVPIWVVGAWSRKQSVERALRYDGLLSVKIGAAGGFEPIAPEDVHEIRRWASEHRHNDGPFDIVIEGVTSTDDPEQARSVVRPFAEAGATWWIESMWGIPGGLDAVRARVAQGPPRIE